MFRADMVHLSLALKWSGLQVKPATILIFPNGRPVALMLMGIFGKLLERPHFKNSR